MPRPRLTYALAVPVIAGALLFAGCDDTADPTDEETTTPIPGAGTAAPAVTPAGTHETPTPTTPAPELVEHDYFTFVAPEGWVGSADTWTSSDGEVTLIWAFTDWEAGTEPEAAMLPPDAVNLDRREIETPIGPGAIHTIEIRDVGDAEVVYERHAIVRYEDRIYDWWLAAESMEHLDAQTPVLEAVLDTVIIEEDAE